MTDIFGILTAMTLLMITFIAGILTVLAPCVLPLLPVIVGGSIATNEISKKKTITVTISLGISVVVFTLLLKVSTFFIMVSPLVWQIISGTIVIFLGLVTLFPSLWEKISLSGVINRKSNKVMTAGFNRHSFWGDVIIGASLGPVFSSCSPTYFLVLATVLPVNFFLGMVYLFSYTIGLCIALFIVALVGQRIVEKLGIAADPRGWFKRTLGVIFIVVGVAVLTGQDKIIEANILSAGFFDITKVEQHLLQSNQNSTTTPQQGGAEKAEVRPLAPEFVSPSGYINTDGKPITLAEFRGKKVVLLDIWTYSCINCQRTLPYVKSWYEKYKDQGLEVIGIHTPEFSFEKIQQNVEEAVAREGIKYPVILDNDYATWNAYGNQYWPRKYLIGIDGSIVYDHIGEGDYDETEKAIQKALTERDLTLNLPSNVSGDISKPKDVVTVEQGMVGSPEIYFGSRRSDPANDVDLRGDWTTTPEYIENQNIAKITYVYNAKNVYMVASSPVGVTVQVLKDGKPFRSVDIKDEKLYPLIEGDQYGQHTIEIDIPTPGLRAFTFTFG